MKTATDYLAEYAAYHRDRRNIAIHGAGIPLIVFALVVLASRATLEARGISVSLAEALLAALVIFYCMLDATLGVAFAVAAVALAAAGNALAGAQVGLWLATGIALFVFGWVLQFVGHAYEGKKPAFLDDVMGLAIGPLFVTAEAFFALGQKQALKAAIEARAGAPHIRNRELRT